MGLGEAYKISCATVVDNCRSVRYEADGVSFSAELILAGSTKHTSTWFRDAFARPEAILRLGKKQVLANTILGALHFQTDDGVIPRRLADKSNLRRNIEGIIPFWPKATSSTLWPEYFTAGGPFNGKRSLPIDLYPLVVSAASKYVIATGNIEVALDYMDELDKLLDQMKRNEHNQLLVRPPQGCWKDHWLYKGKTLLLQLQALEAYRWMARLKEACSAIDAKYLEDADLLQARAVGLEERISELFWSEEFGHYITAIEPLRTQFSVEDNSLAIILGVAQSEQRERILAKLEAIFKTHGYMPLHLPRLSFTEMPPIRIPFAYHYQTGRVCLPWNQCLAAEAIARADVRFAETVLAPIADSIVQFGNVEVLSGDYRPFTPPHMSGFEKKFTWGALSYIEAAEAIAARESSPSPLTPLPTGRGERGEVAGAAKNAAGLRSGVLAVAQHLNAVDEDVLHSG